MQEYTNGYKGMNFILAVHLTTLIQWRFSQTGRQRENCVPKVVADFLDSQIFH